MFMLRFLIAVTLLGGTCLIPEIAAADGAALALLQQQYQERHERFADEMEELAAETEFVSPEAAAAIRQLIPTPGEQSLDIDNLPDHVQQELPASLPDAERHWRSQLQQIRTRYAQDLYRLTRRGLNAEEVAWAFHLLREVAFHDPDHRLARQMLGYVRYHDRWVTPFEQSMLRRGNVWHDQFGWLPQSHVERYERGERYYRNRWMSAEDEAALRHDFKNAWEIESDHFLVKTNQSLERGVELSVALERFHRYFRREFAAFFDSPQQMRELFAGGQGHSQQHEIHYYQSREEFILRLRSKQPGIELSNGLYLPADRTAYFFYNPHDLERNIETLYHEVTHQLLSESQRKVFQVGQNANFWLIEGIACYLESFEVHDDGSVSVGDPRHTRFQSALKQRLHENAYVPLAQFTRMGTSEFQPPKHGQLQTVAIRETLQQLYSQATGLTHFFMHYEDGRYRDALIQHLSQIYSPDPRIRANPQPLDVLTGVSFAELDRQYLSYLTEIQLAVEANRSRQEQ